MDILKILHEHSLPVKQPGIFLLHFLVIEMGTAEIKIPALPGNVTHLIKHLANRIFLPKPDAFRVQVLSGSLFPRLRFSLLSGFPFPHFRFRLLSGSLFPRLRFSLLSGFPFPHFQFCLLSGSPLPRLRFRLLSGSPFPSLRFRLLSLYSLPPCRIQHFYACFLSLLHRTPDRRAGNRKSPLPRYCSPIRLRTILYLIVGSFLKRKKLPDPALGKRLRDSLFPAFLILYLFKNLECLIFFAVFSHSPHNLPLPTCPF